MFEFFCARDAPEIADCIYCPREEHSLLDCRRFWSRLASVEAALELELADEPDTTIEWRDVVLQKYGNDEQETLPLDITDAEAVAEVKPPPFWHCVSLFFS